MAPFRHIFLILALSLLSLCQVFAANTREEWIAALSRIPWLEDRYADDEPWLNEMEDELGNDDDRDMLNDVPSAFFSYASSIPEEVSSYESSMGGEVASTNGTAELRMPNVRPEKPNDYFCHAERMPPNRGVYIVGFEPVTSEGTAHHILIYGCKDPGMDNKETWNCGEMDMARDPTLKNTAPPCATESKILYAWAMDAPPLDLPQGVGFEVGDDTGIDYLVLQVHYNSVDKFEDGSTDDSGVALSWTLTPQPLKAGVYFMGTNGQIPGQSQDVHLEAACAYREKPVLHPFAYRVHAHKLGQVISGYRIRDGSWTEIGKRSPQLPQMFNPITKSVPIEDGDTVAMRCTFNSDRKETTYIGMTGDDEMCNFYIMYYVEDGRLPQEDICYMDAGYQWAGDLTNIPDKEASTLPDEAPINSM